MDEDAKPKPRLLDTLLEAYVQIGGAVGVALAVAAFAGICGGSYWLFVIKHFAHIHSALFAAIIIVATLLIAGSAAISIFFSASLFWLPILIAMLGVWRLALPILARMHHHA